MTIEGSEAEYQPESRAARRSLAACAEDGELERYRLAFDASPVCLMMISFETGRYLDVNRAQAELLGMERNEVLEQDPYELWREVTHPDDFDEERRALQLLVDGRVNEYRLKKRIKRRSGEWRHVEMTATAVRDERGRIRYVVVHTLDVTETERAFEERRELEARLQQSQKLETIGRLVGGVAHDFNNRLLVIMGHAELLRRGTGDNPALESHAEVVLSSARRAADLTRQLLAYGRQQVLNLRPLDMNRIVDGLRRMLERLIGEEIELLTVLGAKNPARADSGQVEQVLLNLVLNARDAMPKGGRVTVETSDIELDGQGGDVGLPTGEYVVLTVSDTGTGIPEAIRTHVFEPFFTTKEMGKGTGLGLATVDGIVRQSGGAIALQSTEGRGTIFTVYLPRARENAVDVPSAPPEPLVPLTGIETVMVVDDEDEVRRLLVNILRIGAYRVLEARDGAQALELALAHGAPLDLLVSDVVMPRVTGPELAEHLRARQPDLKVLYMSGYADRDRLPSLGEDERFLAKPFLPTELLLRVNEFLREVAQRRVERTG